MRGALAGGVHDARLLVRTGNPQIIGGAIGYMAFDVAALAAAFAAIGAVPPIGVLLLAYVVGQLGNLIPLPGGVGGADGGLIAALVLYGTPLASAAAAVLAYRAFQLGLPALLGGLALPRLPSVIERAPDTGALCSPPRARAPAGMPACRGSRSAPAAALSVRPSRAGGGGCGASCQVARRRRPRRSRRTDAPARRSAPAAAGPAAGRSPRCPRRRRRLQARRAAG